MCDYFRTGRDKKKHDDDWVKSRPIGWFWCVPINPGYRTAVQNTKAVMVYLNGLLEHTYRPIKVVKHWFANQPAACIQADAILLLHLPTCKRHYHLRYANDPENSSMVATDSS